MKLESLNKIADLVRDPNVTIDTTAFVFALLMSLAVSFALSLLYQFFFEERATGSQVHRAFILLGPSITALFIAIQYSLPLSLGLLGALSIIRFRTPIKEPEEVGFIMLLVACSVVIATFKLLLLLALLIAVTIGLCIRRYFPSVIGSIRRDGTILLTFPTGISRDGFSEIKAALDPLVKKGKLESVSQLEGMTTVQFSFCDLSLDAVDALHNKLSSFDGVQTVNLYFNRSNSLLG